MSYSNNDFNYWVGGCIPWNNSSYVQRQADEALYRALTQKQLCFVFNSRQQGKSSLRVRTMERLHQDGVRCVVVELTRIGTAGVTPEQWFISLADVLVDAFELDEQVNLEQWWIERNHLTEVRRFSAFIEQILLREIDHDIVIFLDEIDTVLGLEFSTDDFFGVIRECCERRAVQPEYNRLTFALIGVATPSALMQDQARTPFNVGEAIDLRGFCLEECEPLIQGFVGRVPDPTAVMRSILDWTGGQPFLTQRLCRLAINSLEQQGLPRVKEPVLLAETTERWVESLVRSQIIDSWETQDEKEHLRTIRQRLLDNEQRTVKWLGLYQRILREEQVAADDSQEQKELRLTGLVVRQGEFLRVYNRIYREVFNLDWVERELAKLRPYVEQIRGWAAEKSVNTHLLRGEERQAAQAWAAGKSLDDLDYQFLQASLEYDAQQILAAAKQEGAQTLKEAQQEGAQTLKEAQQQANRRIQIGAVVLTVTMVAALVSSIFAQRQVQAARDAEVRLALADMR